MLSRIIAVILLLVGIVGIVVSIAGIWVSYQAVDSLVQVVDEVANAFDQTLNYVSEGLDTVSDTPVGATLEGRVTAINDDVAQTRTDVNNQLRTVRLGLLLVFLWFGLAQLVPLYIGADLIADGTLGSKLVS